MPQSSFQEHECWEYRHSCFEPNRSPMEHCCSQEQDSDFIGWLIETLERIDCSEEGWRMVSAKIESDEEGGQRLDVLMKRPLVDS